MKASQRLEVSVQLSTDVSQAHNQLKIVVIYSL